MELRASRATLLRRLSLLRKEEGEILLELADLEACAAAPVCSSTLALPRGVSRRVFRERCAANLVRGARREGRVWLCAIEDWHTSLKRPPKLRALAATVPRARTQAEDDLARAKAAVEASTARSSRRSA